MPLASEDLQFIQTFVSTHLGSTLAPSQFHTVEQKLRPVAESLGMKSAEQLVAQLRRGAGPSVERSVADAMTINETFFFRDMPAYDALRTAVLPEMMKRRADSRRLSIWCAACSTGQEPYSLAMLISEHLPQLRDWNVSIIATDICEQALAKARSAQYSQFEVNRGLPANLLLKHFQRDGRVWQVADHVRKLVKFQSLNLARAWNITGPFDLVLLRNVLIYFDTPAKNAIFQRLSRVVRPDAFVLLGGGETLLNVDAAFQREEHGRVAFFRPKH